MMAGIQRRGRPAASPNVRIVPEYLEKPDIEKFALALLSVAKKLAEQQRKSGQSAAGKRKGDAVA